MATTAKKFRPGAHSICRSCDLAFVNDDGACSLCGSRDTFACGGPARCAWCRNRWARWKEPQEPEAGMSIKGTVIEGGRLVLENGARLRYGADDCAEVLRPGDAVIVRTSATPPIVKAAKSGAWTPVSETKVVEAEVVKSFEALVQAHGDEL
jgi:hypothetical protein